MRSSARCGPQRVVGNGFTFTGHGDPELAIGQLVSGEFFNLLGVEAGVGTHVRHRR